MQIQGKWNLLFIGDEESKFNSNTEALSELFLNVDKTFDKEESLKFFDEKAYDIVLCDMSVDPTRLAWLKQMKDIKAEQTFFALVDPKDTAKLYGIADLGVNAFELTPEQFDQALQMIADFDPYSKN